jgi:hypothetical protein
MLTKSYVFVKQIKTSSLNSGIILVKITLQSFKVSDSFTLCNGYDGIGEPEPLKHELQGFWS